MRWFDRWLYGKVRDMWDNRHKYEEGQKMNTLSAGLAVERSRVEGEGRITFELSTAVGGKILNVRRYDPRTDRHESTTYVVPNGDNLSERIVKILDLESFK